SAGTWREGKLLETLVPLVDDAVLALARAREVLHETAVARGVDLPAPRRSFALAFVGLRECVRVARGGEVDPTLARAIVQAIVERAAATAAARRLPVFVEPWLPCGARPRFERLDSELSASQAFAEGDRIRYSEGATLSPVAGRDAGAAEGEVLAGVAAGVLPPAEAGTAAAFAAAFARARGPAPSEARSRSRARERDA
ncbi:MAG TPA: hypothetical protein VKE69_07595, partial [Planctomycetota bacterium]|nr:hypothetical protein [Planctomycetota bacterium]